MLRVAVLGKNDIAIEATKILTGNQNCEMVFVSPNNSDPGEDGWQRSFKKFAIEQKIPTATFPKIKSKDSIESLIKSRIDLLFSFQYDQIINQEVIDTAKFGAINLHFAPLPKYRGVSPIAMAMLNGENEFGVTLHYMDPGVDTGDIIAQKIFDMSFVKSARELYDLCVGKSVELLRENVDDILRLKNSRVPQDNSRASYYPAGLIDFKKNVVSWNRDTRSLYNWIRAFIFPPFQYPVFQSDGTTFEVLESSPDYRKNKYEKPGTVVFKKGNFYKVATHDSYLDVFVRESRDKL
ncbi:MAG TPA: formyltransferase family protein [Candidatus Acidoferrales bacterium]|nr:formyltransferase family protein [Candidatus Acidoferrales bacterium]